MTKDNVPLDRLFSELDRDQKGSLTFEEFVMMNEQVGVSLSKKELKQIFDIIDRVKAGKIRLEDIRGISSLVSKEDLTEE